MSQGTSISPRDKTSISAAKIKKRLEELEDEKRTAAAAAAAGGGTERELGKNVVMDDLSERLPCILPRV